MNKELIKINIQLIDETPAPSPSESIDPDHEEGIVLTEEERYAYELDQSELLAEERRNEECIYEWHAVKFCE
jgi:hypothetical protein